MPLDPYTTLGISRNASADEIKKVYRKLAHQHHPDKKGGNEAKFKEINEAYQTLSDPDKRSRYDQFGHAGMGGNPFGGGGGQYDPPGGGFDFSQFGGFEDIFDLFGRGGSSGTTSSRQRPTKGEDLYLEVSISKRDLGRQKIYEFEAFDKCGTCHGSGVAPGAKRIQCKQCDGAGQVRQTVRTPFGTFTQVGVCPKCQGEGDIPEKLCPICGGQGRTKTKRKLELHIPESITDRYLVVFPREGNAGSEGAPAGDLMLTIRLK